MCSKKMKWLIVICSICVICVVLLLLLLSAHVAVSINPFDSGGCVSVAFDKSLMMKADKVLIRDGEKQYEITDPEVIRKIVSETKVATNTDLCAANTDRWIDVYCGDDLVRSMRWEKDHDSIIVYNKDSRHWIFPSMEGKGIIDPSNELLEALNAIVNTDE